MAISAAHRLPFTLWPALLLLGLWTLLYLIHAAQLIAFPFGWDQGEGYDVWSGWLIAQGHLPYSLNHDYPYFSLHYPPLWAALSALPLSVFGPSLAPLRALSVVVVVLDALVLAVAAARRTNGTAPSAAALLAAALAAGFFLASPYTFHTTPLARPNGILLLFGLLALTLAESPTRGRVALAVLALLEAFYVKPTALGAAAGSLGFVSLVRPRLGIAAAGALVGTGLVLLAVLSGATGGAFWHNVVLGNAGPYSLNQAAEYFLNFGLIHPVVLAFAVGEVWMAVRRRAWCPWVLFFPGALAEALLVGESGAGESYFLSLLAASSVLAGSFVGRILGSAATAGSAVAAFSRLMGRVGRAARAALKGGPGVGPSDPSLAERALRQQAHWLLGGLLLLQALLLSHGPLGRATPWLADRGLQAHSLGAAPSESDRKAFDGIHAMIRANPGPLLTEEPSFAFTAERPLVGNAAHLHTLHELGLWDPTRLVTDVEGRRFSVIVLSAQRFPSPVLGAIGSSYDLVGTFPTTTVTYRVFLPGNGAR